MATASTRPKRRPDGTLIGYYIRWYDPERHPSRVERSLRTRDRGEAERKRPELETEERLGLYDPWTDQRQTGSGIALGDAVKEYLAWSENVAGQPSATIRIKRSRLKKLLKVMRTSALLAEVQPRDLEAALGSVRSRDGGKASANTLVGYHATYSGFFSWARDQRHLPALSETAVERVQAPREVAAERVVLMPSEIERIKGTIRAEGGVNGHLANRAFFCDVIDLAVSTGLRVGEVCALSWDHVELSSEGDNLTGTLAVQPYRAGRGRTASFKTKTGNRRRVTLFPRAAEVLARLTEERTGAPGEPVFRGVHGRRLDKQYPTLVFTEYVGTARLHKAATFHSLRHTFISWCCNEFGVPLPVVQKLAGHTNVQTTMKYVHVSERTMLEAMERSLAASGALPPRRGQASRQAAAIAAWLAGSEVYAAWVEEGSRGEYMGNVPRKELHGGRSESPRRAA